MQIMSGGTRSAVGRSSGGGREVPTPPAGVALVIRAAADPDVSLMALSKLVEKEPGLTTAMLKLSNSAAYSNGKPVRTVGQAAIYLGARVIRNIAVSHVVRAMAAKVNTGALDPMLFWEDSLRRACAGLILGRKAGFEDPSEVFTVGLIQDLGVLMAAAEAPELGADLQAARQLPERDRRERERALLGADHAERFVTLGRRWGLPEDLIDAIGSHHTDAPLLAHRRTARLAHLARAADAVADVTQTHGAGDTVARARSIIGALESREALNLEDLVDAVAAEMAVQSADLEIKIFEQPTYQALMESANDTLLQINLSYEDLTRRLEQLLAEKEELARKLKASNEALRRLATTDPLTGCGNRRYFSEAMDRELALYAQGGPPVTVLTLDLDHFKLVNDTYGHAAGDDVLIAVGERLRATVRAGDVVGRIGGEEFAVLLPDCPVASGAAVAERLRQALRASPVRCRDGAELSVTASFGGVSLTAPASADDVLRACDAAMYRSKLDGRDRVTWAEAEN